MKRSARSTGEEALRQEHHASQNLNLNVASQPHCTIQVGRHNDGKGLTGYPNIPPTNLSLWVDRCRQHIPVLDATL